MSELNHVCEMPCGILFHAHQTMAAPGKDGYIPHTHESCELYFFMKGNCSYMVENGVLDLFYGTVVFTRPGELHGVRITEPCEYERCFFYIPSHALDYIGTPSPMRFFFDRLFGQNNHLRLPPESARECLLHVERIRDTLLSAAPDRKLRALAELFLLLEEINRVRDTGDTGMENNMRAQESNAVISEALRCINADIGSIRSVEDLARRLYISREHLSRLFSSTMGVTLCRYITIKRVELAKRLLRENIPLNEVCTTCGWEDYSYFISSFHRETGITPAKYRNNPSQIQRHASDIEG